MDPCKAIKSVPKLVAELELRMDALRREASQICTQWVGLGRVGGQREDHAAQLMTNLTRYLDDIRTQCDIYREQIVEMHLDPFEHETHVDPACQAAMNKLLAE